MSLKPSAQGAPDAALPTRAQKVIRLCATWYELPDTAHRVRSMEGLRGLAVLLVFCVHYHQLLSVYLPQTTWQFQVSYFLSEVGHSGVDLFFILSGYLIYGAAIKPDLKVTEFWKRRIRRIYPTFLAVFAIYVLLGFVFPDRSKFPGDFWPNVAFLAGNLLMMAGLTSVVPLNTVTWSLSFEMFYYLTLPLLVRATGMSSWRRSSRIALILGTAGVYAVLFVSGVLFRPGYWTHARMLMFVAGILLYERVRSKRPPVGSGRHEILVATLFLASFPALFFLHELTLRPDLAGRLRVLTFVEVLVLAVPYYLFCLYCCFSVGGRLRRLFEWSPLRWLGNMSYSYYLIHGLVIHSCALVIQRFRPVGIHDPTMYWSAVPAVLMATLAGSTALFLTVERPLSMASTGMADIPRGRVRAPALRERGPALEMEC